MFEKTVDWSTGIVRFQQKTMFPYSLHCAHHITNMTCASLHRGPTTKWLESRQLFFISRPNCNNWPTAKSQFRPLWYIKFVNYFSGRVFISVFTNLSLVPLKSFWLIFIGFSDWESSNITYRMVTNIMVIHAVTKSSSFGTNKNSYKSNWSN